MLDGTCEQHFESFVLNTYNVQKSAWNQINSPNASYENYEFMEIFHGFRVFEYVLWQKKKRNPGNAGNQQKAF